MSLPAADIATSTVEHSLAAARTQTLALVDGLADSGLERVHSPLMSPLVWDLGHIAAFEDLWLCHRHGGLELLHHELMDVYDAFETPRSKRGELPYLSSAAAREYLAAVRARVEELAPGPLHELVLRHERQHNETMLQTLNLAHVERPEPAYRRPPPPPPDRALSGLDLVAVAGGEFPLGAPDVGFAYDNERSRHTVAVAPFAIGRVPVTNGDWLEFVADGGYRRREWWTEDGWAWRAAEVVERPLNWLSAETEWRFGGAGPIEARLPVLHVSWYEADAFARARGLRLPDEAEWELAASWDGEIKHAWPWGATEPGAERANLIESRHFGPLAAGTLAAGTSPCGALGMIGDVWEWTSSNFAGYPGFVPHPYREYSEVFFGPDHRVLRGGSWASSADVVTPTFRNWDFPQRRQIFAGLRVAA